MVEEFDELFRNHLMNVYRILGREVPDHLKIPILRKGKQAKATLEQVGLIRPAVDGHVTSYFEWLSAGFYDTTKTGAAMHQVHYLVSRIYYGCDLERLYLRFDFSPPSNEVRSRDYVLLVHFLEPSPRRLHLRLSPEGTRPVAILFQNNEDREWIKVEEQPEAAMAEILELSLRLAALGAQGDQEVRFFVTVSQPEGEDREIERWPSRGYISQVIPTADFDALRWSV